VGRFVHEVEVGFAVDLPKRRVRQIQHIDVANRGVGRHFPQCQLDGLGRTHVPGTDRCREN
jgi:hypothetical protein